MNTNFESNEVRLTRCAVAFETADRLSKIAGPHYVTEDFSVLSERKTTDKKIIHCVVELLEDCVRDFIHLPSSKTIERLKNSVRKFVEQSKEVDLDDPEIPLVKD